MVYQARNHPGIITDTIVLKIIVLLVRSIIGDLSLCSGQLTGAYGGSGRNFKG